MLLLGVMSGCSENTSETVFVNTDKSLLIFSVVAIVLRLLLARAVGQHDAFLLQLRQGVCLSDGDAASAFEVDGRRR